MLICDICNLVYVNNIKQNTKLERHTASPSKIVLKVYFQVAAEFSGTWSFANAEHDTKVGGGVA